MEKPVRVLARMNLIKRMAANMLHHDRGANYMTVDDFTRAYWRTFPARMHDWLTNEQNINPFDAAAPMDAMEIADQFQRYWNLHFKNEKKKDNDDSGKKRKDRDGDDDDLRVRESADMLRRWPRLFLLRPGFALSGSI